MACGGGVWESSYEWGLFSDWCLAAGYESLPTRWEVVALFLAEVPCSRAIAARRVRVIHRVHAEQGYRLRSRLPSVRHGLSAWRAGVVPVDAGGDGQLRWLTLGEALELLPVQGFPEGVVARRDGLILVVLGLLGLTRAQVVALTCNQVDVAWDEGQQRVAVRVAGRGITATDDAGECPVCAVTRWLRVLSAWHREWRRQVPFAVEEATRHGGPGHDCVRPVPSGWQHAPVVVAQVGRVGLPAFDLQALSAQAIPQITRARLHPVVAAAPIEQGQGVSDLMWLARAR